MKTCTSSDACFFRVSRTALSELEILCEYERDAKRQGEECDEILAQIDVMASGVKVPTGKLREFADYVLDRANGYSSPRMSREDLAIEKGLTTLWVNVRKRISSPRA